MVKGRGRIVIPLLIIQFLLELLVSHWVYARVVMFNWISTFIYWYLGFNSLKMAASRTGVQSMKDYLKKYESSDVIDKKKKKKKKPSKPEPKGVLVVDEDPVWQKQIDPEEEENEDDAAGNGFTVSSLLDLLYLCVIFKLL